MRVTTAISIPINIALTKRLRIAINRHIDTASNISINIALNNI